MSSLAILGAAAPSAMPLPALGAGSGTLGAGAGAGSLGASAGAGYGLSLADLGGFEQALQRAQLKGQGLSSAAVTPASETVAQVFKPFDHINAEASSLAQMAEAARNAGAEMSPGEVVQLTLRCQEFMFHCQLTSNIANRSSDGLQQLFRQQG
jgi:hypothetical protein